MHRCSELSVPVVQPLPLLHQIQNDLRFVLLSLLALWVSFFFLFFFAHKANRSVFSVDSTSSKTACVL